MNSRRCRKLGRWQPSPKHPTSTPLPRPDLARLVGEAQPLLEAIAALSTAPLATIAQRLREATLPYVGSSALVIFTEDCTGRPQKKAGDEVDHQPRVHRRTGPHPGVAARC